MGLEFLPGWLIEELADPCPVNEIVGGSVLVQLLDKPGLICGLARFLAKNQEPVAPVCVPPSSPWRNPFFLSDGSDNGDSGSFEMDEAAEAKNKGLCYRC